MRCTRKGTMILVRTHWLQNLLHYNMPSVRLVELKTSLRAEHIVIMPTEKEANPESLENCLIFEVPQYLILRAEVSAGMEHSSWKVGFGLAILLTSRTVASKMKNLSRSKCVGVGLLGGVCEDSIYYTTYTNKPVFQKKVLILLFI